MWFVDDEKRFSGSIGGGVKKVDTYLVCGEIFCGKGVGCVCDVT